MSEREPDYLFDEDFGEEFDDECLDDCGLMPDGQCMLAGTEWCDWDCGALD